MSELLADRGLVSIAVLRFDPGLDLFPMLAATLAAIACGVLGNFLLLRRESMMGDAISHSVLPGLVIAFLIAGTRSPLAMFLGAAAAGVVTVVLIELVKRLGRVEPGAAMGVVFSLLFALGVLLIERSGARGVDLDADCVLYGQLETLVWFDAPAEAAELMRWSTFEAMPRQVVVLGATAALAIAFVVLLFKELRLAAFDPGLATSQGFDAHRLHLLLMVLVAVATVASFEAVGSILVIAMLVCPAATARMLTDRLDRQIAISVLVAAATAIAGYAAAGAVPAMFGRDAVNAAGSMTVAGGVLLAIAMVASPRHGVLTKFARRRRLAARIAVDDLLASLHRAAEQGLDRIAIDRLGNAIGPRRFEGAIGRAIRAGQVERTGHRIGLTATGRVAAAALVDRHRSWERYLVEEAGFAPDHVHDPAERLEHLSGTTPDR
ncbi:MAG: metal ABC transporter permease [Planctomycetota bacterium]|jgi:manganese/zinc/iron transport system permease protein